MAKRYLACTVDPLGEEGITLYLDVDSPLSLSLPSHPLTTERSQASRFHSPDEAASIAVLYGVPGGWIEEVDTDE